MEAPDKIYLVRDAVNPEGIFDSVASKNPMFYDDIAYIRKDALLEWAKNELESARQTDFDEFGRGEVITLERIIKKINSL